SASARVPAWSTYLRAGTAGQRAGPVARTEKESTALPVLVNRYRSATRPPTRVANRACATTSDARRPRATSTSTGTSIADPAAPRRPDAGRRNTHREREQPDDSRPAHGVVTVSVKTSPAEYVPGESPVHESSIRKNTVFDHGSFNVFFFTGRDSIVASAVVMAFHAARSALRHCRSLRGLLPPSEADDERTETMVVRFCEAPPVLATW